VQPFSLTVPRDLVFGSDSFEKLGDLAKGLGDKAFVLLLNAPQKDEIRSKVEKLLSDAGVAGTFADGPAGEPTIQDADETAKLCKDAGCNLVISIGGGSIMDLGKAVAFLNTNEGSSREYQMTGRQITNYPIPHIAVSTTSGTGSEGTKVVVLSNKEEHVKKSIANPRLVPSIAVLDPKLTATLPKKLTALTGLDALSHALESFVSLNANPVTEAFSAKAIELIGRNLKKAVDDGSDLVARGNMAIGSYLAGVSLNAGVGAAHILAQPLGAAAGLSHSEAIAAVLPFVVEANSSYSVEKYAYCARILDESLKSVSDAEAAAKCSQAFVKFWDDLGVCEKLTKYGLDRSGFDNVLDIASRSTNGIVTNPRKADREMLIEILEKAL